jgi:putative thioredoxin
MAKISARGAVDLGALATARQNEQRAATAMAHAPAGVVINATDATFESEVLQRSLQVPVVIDLWAEWCGPCKQLSPVLETLAAEGGGQWVLAKVDVDANPAISQAFQVQSIPAVFAAIGGRVLPLFNGVYPESQIRQILEELLRVAAEQGLPGAPIAGSEAGGPEGVQAGSLAEPAADPRFDAAYEAIERGDWDAADKAYRAVLAASPNDPDAVAGLALVGIYARTNGAQQPSVTSTPEDMLLAADFAALDNDWPRAFELSIGVVRDTSGDDRDAARQRVLDYFAVAGNDPAVPAARAALSNALF